MGRSQFRPDVCNYGLDIGAFTPEITKQHHTEEPMAMAENIMRQTLRY